MAERRIKIVVDPSGAEQGARRVNSSLDSMDSRTTALGRSFGSLSSGLAVMKAGAFAAAGTFAALAASFAKGLQEAENFAKSTRQLDAVLLATGNKIGVMRGELISFATELEGKLAIPAEDIIKTQAALATFDGVSGPIFKRTIQAAADLSATFGGDLQSNAEKVGSTLQNLSNRDVDGLSRGFRFLGAETLEMIEKLALTGKTAQAQERLLAELEKRIGGQGEAAAGGLSGATFRLRTSWEGLLQSLGEGKSGEVAIKMIDRLAVKISSLEPALKNAIVGFDALMKGESIDETVRDAMLGVTDAPGSGKVKGGRGRGGSSPGFAGGWNPERDRDRKLQDRLEREQARERLAAERTLQTLQRQGDTAAERAHQKEIDALRSMLSLEEERLDRRQRLYGDFSTRFDEQVRAQGARFRDDSSIFDAGGTSEIADITKRALADAGFGTGEEIARGFRSEGALAAEAIGKIIGGRLGSQVQTAAGAIQGFSSGDFTGVRGPLGGALTMFGSKGKVGDALRETYRPVTNIFKRAGEEIDLAFGKSGAFTRVLGSAVGGAGLGGALFGGAGAAGGAIGGAAGQVASELLGDSLGKLGGALGPLGGIAGAVLGGLLSKVGPTARAYANLVTDSVGGVTVSSGGARGKNAGQNSAVAAQAAGGVADALASILGLTGGRLRANSTIGTIGPVGDQFGFATTGAVGGSNKSLIKFSTAEEATQALIKSVFQRGLVDGLDSFIQRALSSTQSLEKSLDVAAKYKTVMDSLGEVTDPLGAAARSAVRDFDQLVTEMRSFGATAAELAKVEDLRSRAMKQALEEQLSGLQGFQALLSGPGSGETTLSLLSRSLADYEKQRGLIGQEGFNQAEFTRLGQEVFSFARDTFGTSTQQFQDLRQRLIADTAGAIGATETAFNAAAEANKPVVAALDQQTTVATQSYGVLQTIAGHLMLNQQALLDIAESLAGGGGSSSNGALSVAVR